MAQLVSQIKDLNKRQRRAINSSSKNKDPRHNLVKEYSRYTDDIMERLRNMSSRKAAYDDPQLIDIAKELIDLPSARKFIKLSRHFMKTLQADSIDNILKQKKNGFFVEAGAQDGEQLSNSIFFERHRNWSGLLVEMDPYMYLQLLGKSRSAYSINACLSPYSYVTLMNFRETDGGQGTLIADKGGKRADESKGSVAPCFPLSTLLLAINVSHVDYLSLDVEGYELPILDTLLNNEKIVVDTMSIEYGKGGKEKYRKYLEKKKYKILKTIDYARPQLSVYVVDFIAARNDLKIK